MIDFSEINNLIQFENSIFQEITLAALVFISVIVLIKFFKIFILFKLNKLSEKKDLELFNVLTKIVNSFDRIFYLISAIYFSSQFLILPTQVSTLIYYVFLITVVFYFIRSVRIISSYLLQKTLKTKNNKTVTGFFDFAIKLLLWTIALLLVLSNMGFDITALIASFGIVGLAIAFALQKIFEDIFSAFSIYYDKPFEIGDFIITGGDMGIVKNIGIKSTRIQTLQGQELVISNKELTDTRINNFKKMKKRRILFHLGLTYDTPVKKLEKVPTIIKKIIEKEKVCDFDRANFQSYGDFSLNFEIVYYLTVPDYNAYMDIQEKINLEIKKAFEKEKIEFAFPTQTVYYSKQ